MNLLETAEEGGEHAEAPDEGDELPADLAGDLGRVFERVEDGEILVNTWKRVREGFDFCLSYSELKWCLIFIRGT